MKLLITGGCGFIGSNFVNRYASEHEITVIDALTYASNVHYLDSVMDKIKLIIGDIRYYDEVDRKSVV
jgi:dTDP-glucose 4,6-dehydratase